MAKRKKVIITGGAGFIGTNTAEHFAGLGYDVVIIDNLSRRGTNLNLQYLKEHFPIIFYQTDIRDFDELSKVIETHQDADAIIHLAGQVAVTTSITNPRTDFEINALGTFNLLEAVRLLKIKPLVLFASTNKVYGGLESAKIKELKNRYALADLANGVSEDMILDFHSPYGVSKGAADQYVRDYARVYGIPTLVVRQSCIYGPHQFGIEDQGWVAWFLIAAVLKKPITVYGNGKQVRDLLHVSDLVKLYELAITNKKTIAGNILNVGGGVKNTMSVWTEFKEILAELGLQPKTKQADWREGDQPIYISDIRKAKKLLGWQPKIGVKAGIAQLHEWIKANQEAIKAVF